MRPVHREFFYFGICHFCKSDSEEIQRCSSCKTVGYCSKKHQKSDWQNHKRLCKAIAVTSKTLGKFESRSFEEWKNYRISCQIGWMNALKRELQPFECQMWMFPRICNLCYSTKNLMECHECRNVAYCSHEHLEQDKTHGKFCASLKLCMDIDRYLAKTTTYPQIKLKEIISSVEGFPEDIGKLMDAVEKKSIFAGDGQVERVLKADSIAPGAIILHALEISRVTQYQQNQLVLHVVGASAAEGTADWGIISELIFHWKPKLDEILYIFVGPEAWPISADSFKLCQTCKEKQKVLNVKVLRKLYHEVVDSVDMPDLVISFNSGLHEFQGQIGDEWQKSIPTLVRNVGVPFVFTSYTEEEMLRDLKRVKDVRDLKLEVLKCSKNPFASPRPIRDWCTENIPVFYSNGYITIVKRL